jgi:hypothetical protein
MPRVLWPLRHDQPCVEIVLPLGTSGQEVVRHLLADTGAGTVRAGFELILAEADCLQAGASSRKGLPWEEPSWAPTLCTSSAFGFRVWRLTTASAQLGLPALPPALEGLAGFRFLNRFSYGNFGNPSQFGLEL